MKAISFKEQTIVIGENQDEYLSLPAFQHNDRFGTLTFCWKPTFKERLKIMFGGNIWQSVLTFNSPLQPQRMLGFKPMLRDESQYD